MSIEDRRWVLYASQVCQVQGCQFTRAVDALQSVQEVGKMAQASWSDDVALWCGVGGHSFSQRDPGKQRVTVEQWDEEGQEMRPVTVAACGEHARPVQITTRPKQAITNGPVSVHDPAEATRRGYDPDYVKWLEAQQADAVPEDS